MRSAYSRLRPNNALCVALLKAGSDRGVDWLNLGSSEGLPGVARFKRDLGARNNTYVTVRYERAQLTAWNRLRAMWNPSEYETTRSPDDAAYAATASMRTSK
jgi:hypothetical protein